MFILLFYHLYNWKFCSINQQSLIYSKVLNRLAVYRCSHVVAAEMANFSDANLSKKLSELNASQQSIQTLSLWLIHHRKHSSTIVDVWLKELKKGECFPQTRF